MQSDQLRHARDISKPPHPPGNPGGLFILRELPLPSVPPPHCAGPPLLGVLPPTCIVKSCGALSAKGSRQSARDVETPTRNRNNDEETWTEHATSMPGAGRESRGLDHIY